MVIIMDKVNRVMLTSLFTNIFLSIFKIIFGILGSSGALIADGIHSLSDMMTDIFASLGNIISKKPADKEHPFGHGNAEYITCLVIGIIIFMMGVNVIVSAATKSSNIPDIYVSIVSLVTIIIKLVLSSYIIKKGKEYDSNILTSSGKESLTDVISSFIVLLSVILSNISKKIEVLSYSDKIAMIVVGALIINISIEIIKENLSNLLGKKVLDEEYIKFIKKTIKKYKDINNIDSLIIIKYGPLKKIDCEVSMDENMQLKKVHNIIDDIEKDIKRKDDTITNIMIHVNPSKSI